MDFITEDGGFGRIRVLSFEHCRNVAIVGPATWDTESLAYTEGRIMDIGPEQGTYDLDVLDDYPMPRTDEHKRLQYFDPQGYILSWSQMGCKEVQSLGGRRFRIVLGPGLYWKYAQNLWS